MIEAERELDYRLIEAKSAFLGNSSSGLTKLNKNRRRYALYRNLGCENSLNEWLKELLIVMVAENLR